MSPRVTWWVTVAALAVAAYLIADVLGAASVVVASSVLHRWPQARLRLGLLATALVAAAPVLWLIGNRTRSDQVSFALVSQNPWPNRVVVVALGLLVVITFLEPPSASSRKSRG